MTQNKKKARDRHFFPSLTIKICKEQMTSSIVRWNLQLPDIQTMHLMTLINIFVSVSCPSILQKLLFTQNRYLLAGEFILIRTALSDPKFSSAKLNFKQRTAVFTWIRCKECWKKQRNLLYINEFSHSPVRLIMWDMAHLT